MEQQVYMDLDTYNGLQLQQQQQQQFIMSGGDSQQQDAIVQEDQQQHIVYSPMKQNEQYISQEDAMQNQYLIQSPTSQQPQQVFYANISPQNQNRMQQQQQQQQTIALNHNLIQQNQQKLVLQAPKVVVQRNTDLLQSTPNMAQIVDHQNQQTIQYHFAQQMDQPQQLIIQQQPAQQIKQTIYPQQPNQVVSQPHYFQLQQIQQPNVVQQGTKILMQSGNQVQYSFIPKQQQQQQIQSGQIMQLNQQQIQTPSPVRHFRPRMITPVRLQGVRVQGSPQIQQQQPQLVAVSQQRPRTSKPRIVRPTAQNSLPPLQQSIQNSQQQQRPSPQPNRTVYIVQTKQDGTQVLVPHPQFNQPSQQTQQIVRMVQQKVLTTNQPQHYQTVQAELADIGQQPQVIQVDETHPPTTSTFTPKKDGDCDDLEDSITATAISKSARSEPPPLQPQSGSISIDEYRKRGLQPTGTRVGVVRPMMNAAGSPLRAPIRNPAQQVIRQRPMIRQRPLPRAQFQQPGLTQQLEVPERESAKMLVILENGEQRLITFTLPKETCTVQELLDQVGIHVGADSNIECIENPGTEIDYIVKVGNFESRDTAAMTKAAENHIRQQQQRLIQNQRNVILQHQQPQQVVPPLAEVAKPKASDLPPAKYVTGFYAVCAACGFSGADHAKCERCCRIFTEEPKMQRMTLQVVANSPAQKIVQTIGRSVSLDKKDQLEAIQKKHQLTVNRQAAGRGRGGIVTSTPRGRGTRGPRKPVVPEVVTLSSDDEGNSSESKSSTVAIRNDEKIVTKKHFEPEVVEDVVTDDFDRRDVTEFEENEQKMTTSVVCRTIRIGSYKFDSKEKVVITPKGIRIIAPAIKSPKDLIVLDIQHSEIIKVVAHFSKQLHIIFLYTKPSCARFIAEQLEMSQTSDKSPFYSPLARSEPQKKIVLLAETVSEDTKNVIKSIYNRQVLEEINNRDANEMLVRSTGIPLTSGTGNVTAIATPNNTADASSVQEMEVRKLLIYPPGRGGLAINTHDYACLGSDIYLNDVIIDFYLKYLHREVLTEEQRGKTFMFSQFFYKRLTTMNKEKDPKLSAAQKRHARVATWTKNINLFDHDFIVIPINEQSHWFLAIICFPNLTEPHTMDTNQPIKLIPIQKRSRKKAATVQIGNTTITPLNKKDETINLNEDETSERDEAEGDDSELGSNLESDDEEEVVDRGQPVKVPCILIFDSLLGAPRNRVVATLRDYLTCEFKAKFPNAPPRSYTKANMFGNQLKVPQQNNFTDCGLFLLQYVEQFFKDPIKDFRIPIKSMLSWFHQDVVTKKREEIALLLQRLILLSHPDGLELPEIEFPTKNGKILDQPDESQEAEESAFDDDDYVPTAEDLEQLAEQNGSKSQPPGETKRVFLAKKRSLDKNESSSSESSAKTPKLARNKS